MKSLLIVLIVPLLITCTNTHHYNNNTYHHTAEETAHNLPRGSFMFVAAKEENKICFFKRCIKIGETARYIGSGFVIKNTKNGSLVITAAHVCTSESIALYTTFKLIDIDGKKYKAAVLAKDNSNDICMLFAKGLQKPPVKIATYKPLPGSRIYNIGAPVGIFDRQMVPINEGFYNGEATNKWGLDRISVYTLPAAPGSSGSMILNNKFELVGLIHSLLIRFPVISLGPAYDSLMDFIEDNNGKYSHL
jgi:S1-C subfamily serine protease